MRRILGVVSICYLTSVVSVWADTATTIDPNGGSVEGTSVAEEKSFLHKFNEMIGVNYYGIYRGASLTDIKSSSQPKIDGTPDESNPQSLENYLTVGYKLNKNLMVGVIGHFLYFPVGHPVGTGNDLQMLDPALALLAPNFINKGGLRIGARFMLQTPFTKWDDLQSRNVAAAATPMILLNYDVPKTKLTLGIVGYFKQYIATAASPSDVRTYKAYLAPNLNYQFSKKVAATVWVDWIQATRNRGTGFISGADNGPMDIEPGINWDITDNISFNPILNIYPSNPTLAATSIQAVFVART